MGLSTVAMQMRGPLLPDIRETFSISESLLGLVAPAGTGAFLVPLLTVGMMAGRINIKRFLLTGTAFTVVSTFMMGLSSSYSMFLTFLLASGLSSGIVRGLDRPILTHLFPSRRGWIFSQHGLVWGIGGTIGPLFVSLITSRWDWRSAYLLLSLTFIPIFILIWRIELPTSIASEATLSMARLGEISSHPAIVGIVIALILYGGIEGAFFTWLPYYVSDFYPRTIANLALSGFIAAYIPGRYVGGRLSEKFSHVDLVFVNSILGVLFLLVAFVLTSGFVMLICIFIVGFLVSSIFPLLLAEGTNLFPSHSGPINALSMGSGITGLSVFSTLIGVIAELSSVATAMRLPIFLMLGISVIALLINRRQQ
jgi:fucose permease